MRAGNRRMSRAPVGYRERMAIGFGARRAAATALATIGLGTAMTGCGGGAAGTISAATATRLAAYVTTARAEAHARHRGALHTTLHRFMAAVERLRASGRIDAALAASLRRQAVAIDAAAASVLGRRASRTVRERGQTPMVSDATAAQPPVTSAATATAPTPPGPPPGGGWNGGWQGPGQGHGQGEGDGGGGNGD